MKHFVLFLLFSFFIIFNTNVNAKVEQSLNEYKIEQLQKGIDDLKKEIEELKKDVDDTKEKKIENKKDNESLDKRIGDINFNITAFAIFITVLLLGFGFLAYRNAKADAKKEAEDTTKNWLENDGNNQLTTIINKLEEEARHKIEEAVKTAKEDIKKQAEAEDLFLQGRSYYLNKEYEKAGWKEIQVGLASPDGPMILKTYHYNPKDPAYEGMTQDELRVHFSEKLREEQDEGKPKDEREGDRQEPEPLNVSEGEEREELIDLIPRLLCGQPAPARHRPAGWRSGGPPICHQNSMSQADGSPDCSVPAGDAATIQAPEVFHQLLRARGPPPPAWPREWPRTARDWPPRSPRHWSPPARHCAGRAAASPPRTGCGGQTPAHGARR